jgi:hypothetical protein
MGALLTALTITGDIVGRMARNHPHATLAAFACTVTAVVLGAVASYGLPEGSAVERRLLQAGLVILGLGLMLAVNAAVATWGDRSAPRITFTTRPGAVVVTVKSDGLRARDLLVFQVEQLVETADARGGRVWMPERTLYRATLGPDDGGTVSHAATVKLPSGELHDLGARAWVGAEPKDCYGEGRSAGCVRLHLGRTVERPQLTVTWETFVRTPRLGVRVRARNLGTAPARAVRLRVFAAAVGQPPQRLAEWSLAPDGDGGFDRRLSVVVGRAYTEVCVVASVSGRDESCPAPRGPETVWARLTVPPLR